MDKAARTLKKVAYRLSNLRIFLNAQGWENLTRTPMFSHGKHGSADGLKPIRVPGERRCVVLASLLSRV